MKQQQLCEQLHPELYIVLVVHFVRSGAAFSRTLWEDGNQRLKVSISMVYKSQAITYRACKWVSYCDFCCQALKRLSGKLCEKVSSVKVTSCSRTRMISGCVEVTRTSWCGCEEATKMLYSRMLIFIACSAKYGKNCSILYYLVF